MKILHSDNGGEYVSHAFTSYLAAHGVIHYTTCPHTLKENDIVERKNRHLLEVTRALLFQIKVPKVFWADALLTTAYLINRVPTHVLNFQCPLQVLSPTST